MARDNSGAPINSFRIDTRSLIRVDVSTRKAFLSADIQHDADGSGFNGGLA